MWRGEDLKAEVAQALRLFHIKLENGVGLGGAFAAQDAATVSAVVCRIERKTRRDARRATDERKAKNMHTRSREVRR